MDDKRADAEERSPALRELKKFADRVAVRGAPLDRTRQLDLAAAEVFRAFATAQVDAVLLKGPALARLLYTDAEVRLYSDIDLLVAPPDLERARVVLADLGYGNEGGDALGIRDVGGVMHAESWVITGPELADYQLIDLHSWLPGAKASAEDAWDCLVKRRTEVELCGELVPVLNRDGLAMHLALHAAQHGPSSPRGLDELELGLERWSLEVWERAATLAAEIGAVERFAAGLRLVPAGAELAEVLALPSTDQLDWEIRNASVRPRGTFHLQALLDKRGARERARVLRHALVPSRAWMATEYRWAHDGGTLKLIAAYGVHLVSAPAWALRAWLYRRRAARAATRGTPPQ
jgi:hypothetical protein